MRASGASIIQIETVGKGLLIIVTIMLSVAMLGSGIALWTASRAFGEAERAVDRAGDAERRAALAERRLERELGVEVDNE